MIIVVVACTCFSKVNFSDGYVSHNELVKHTVKALYSMDEEEAESEFIDADIDGDDRVR